MTTISTGEHELTQLISNHVFCYQYGHVLTAVVNRNGEVQHFRRNHGPSGPGLDWLSVILVCSNLHLLQQMQVNEWTFFKRSWHLITLPCYLVALRRRTMRLVVRLLVLVL